MRMFDYPIKIKAALIGALVVLIVFVIFLISYNNSYSNDLSRVAQAREIASALEYYFDKNNAYPESTNIDLSSIEIITENGVNQIGDYLYYQASGQILEGVFVSNKGRYIIQFDVDNSWELWGISNNSGTTCRVSNYLEMICQSSN